MQGDVLGLVAAAQAVGVGLDVGSAGRLLGLLELVQGAPLNLTSASAAGEMVPKHLLDSLAGVGVAAPAPGDRAMDLGSGGGFPGLPLAVVRPDIEVLVVDATEKKVEFLRTAIRALDVGNARAVHGRAEELGRNARWRERLDYVVARAVAPLPTLVEYALPLCRLGGRFVALKGPRAGAELVAAWEAIELLGGGEVRLHEYRLPAGDVRVVVAVEKVRPTPDRYPRRVGVPVRRPLSR